MALPTLRQLKFLAALGDTTSFSQAAEACHVSQPTLSSAISELEALLGVKLAERNARGARLTNAGRAAVDRARSILADTEDFVASVREAGELLSGTFHLGAIPTIAPYVLPQTVAALKRAHPHLKLYLREDQTKRLIDALRLRTLDAAIIALPWQASGVESVSLADDIFLLAAPAEHRLAEKDDLFPDDLVGEDLLLLEDGHCLREHALTVCAGGNGQRGAEVAATSLNTLVNMVAGSLGISLLPGIAVTNGLNIGSDVAVRPFVEPVIGRSIGIAWRTGSAREEEARLIGETVRSVLGNAVKAPSI